jgi:hypothetical protein
MAAIQIASVTTNVKAANLRFPAVWGFMESDEGGRVR